MQHRGVHVLDMEDIVNRAAANLIGCPDRCAALDAASGHPGGEAVAVVIATAARSVLRRWLTTELTAPDDQRVLQESSFLEVLNQPGNWLVGFARMQVVIGLHVRVSIPVVVVVSTTGINLHETNTSFDHAASQQTLTPELFALRIIQAVQFLSRLRLLRNINSFRSL